MSQQKFTGLRISIRRAVTEPGFKIISSRVVGDTAAAIRGPSFPPKQDFFASLGYESMAVLRLEFVERSKPVFRPAALSANPPVEIDERKGFDVHSTVITDGWLTLPNAGFAS